MRNEMMSRVFLIAVAIGLLAAAAFASKAEIYGKGVELEKATPIAAILADPDAYIGQTVRVEGGVLDVCPKKGCWIEIGDEKQHIQIKVDDDVIVFPATATGRLAAAQGEVEAIEMTREKYLGWLAHRAEEKGEEFDAEAAEVGDGPYRIIRIKGAGARIE
ncbi:MAG: DUF4920 domain-containing protein [bacterium]|nr:DUF4920 domain-containing protein [bacterium]